VSYRDLEEILQSVVWLTGLMREWARTTTTPVLKMTPKHREVHKNTRRISASSTASAVSFLKRFS
jgi:hypothetical protein